MGNKRKPKIQQHTGDSLHIEFLRWISGNQHVKAIIVLRPITPISIYGKDNPAFEWEGSYGTGTIKVSVARQSSERDAVITGDFPNEIDPDRGTTHDQLYDELRRVLRQLN